MIAEARKQYVTTARAKGVPEVRIAARHQFRNAAPALVTMIFYDFARIFVGDALVVEVVFGISGVGGLASVAFAEGDIYVAQAAVVVAAFIVALSNLAADIALRRMDPRARELVNLKRST
jgi:peptide/nickel transport system permease protein